MTAAAATGNVFTNNTVTGNGVGIPSGLVQSAGIAVRTGAASTVLDRNVIRANYGAGVQVNDGSTGTRMTRNSFALNGTITARNGAAATGQIGIDLNSPTDDVDFGTSPFYTLNDLGDADAGGNGLLNFPVLRVGDLVGGNLILRGYARPGSVIELFIASPDPTGFGEGTTYGITLTEGGTGPAATTRIRTPMRVTGTYGPGLVNGIAQGTDTTNRFAFTFPVPGGVGVGTPLTATATLGGETSEFSGNVTVTIATAVTLMSFEAAPSDGAVDLRWRTGSELQNLGFHLYRGPSATGPWTRLTPTLIPGLGFSPLGRATPGATAASRTACATTTVSRTSTRVRLDVPRAGLGGARLDGCLLRGRRQGGSGGSELGRRRARSSCPAWALAQLGSSASYACETHGDPAATSFRVLSRTSRSAFVELETGGFLTARDASGRVRALVPGFDSL